MRSYTILYILLNHSPVDRHLFHFYYSRIVMKIMYNFADVCFHLFFGYILRNRTLEGTYGNFMVKSDNESFRLNSSSSSKLFLNDYTILHSYVLCWKVPISPTSSLTLVIVFLIIAPPSECEFVFHGAIHLHFSKN